MLDRLEHDLDGNDTKLSNNDLKKLLVWKGVSVMKDSQTNLRGFVWVPNC